ncbi:hypothetical protein [Pseudoalteromonas peptidolytica]|nr:hypothetical protein [Pseudoalteromonas peptidolytica]NLR16547.1 hypothetical protein [Pseudoalteromonas peptidolytica]
MRLLEVRIEDWARWTINGEARRHSSILQMIMAGHCFSGGAGSSQPLIECAELVIESALASLSVSNPKSVEVFRAEYGVLKLGSLPLDAPQHQKSLKLGIGLRTYRRKLAETKLAISTALKEEKYL